MMEPGLTIRPTAKEFTQSLFHSLPRAEKALGAFADLNQSLYQTPNLYQFANKSLDYAFQVVGGQAGSLLLASPKTKHLQFFLSKGTKPVPRWTKVGWNLGIAGHVFHSGHSEFVSDAPHDPRHFHEIDRLTGYTTQNLIATPIRHPEGNSIGVVEILNLTQNVPNEEDTAFLQMLSSLLCLALHQEWNPHDTLQESKDNFVKDCAHDMKNLLMPILEGKDFLKEELVEMFGNLTPPATTTMQRTVRTCQESLDMIDRNAMRLRKRAKDLVDCLMELTSLQEIKPCNLWKIMNEALETLSFLTQKKGVVLQKKGLEHLPIIQADERKLFSVCYNLLHNAVSAIQHGGTIGIQGYPHGDHVCINIWDNGPGIPSHEVDGIFSHKGPNKKSLGNSYGMKSVRNAVEEHGGYIKIQSGVGIGTTCHISLPIHGHAEGAEVMGSRKETN